jgi:hypothetical protein
MKSRVSKFAAGIAVFVMGAATGIFMHYVLHRLMLPTEPFIYVVF